MRLIYIAIKLKVKELLCHKAYVVVLFLLPFLILVLGSYSMKNMEQVSLKAGIYLKEDTPLALRMQEILTQDTSIEFKVYTDEVELEKAVATTQIECGFIITPDIEKVIDEKNDEEAIIMLISPASIAVGPIQETVGAAFFRLTAADVAVNSLKDKPYMQGVEGLEEKINRSVEAYYKNGDLMKVQLVTNDEMDDGIEDNQVISVVQLCKGFIGVFLFVASMLLGVKIVEERKGELYKRFITIKKSLAYIEYVTVAASSLCQMVVGGMALGILYWITKMPLSIELLREFGRLVIYIVAMNSLVLVISLGCTKEEIWLGMIPVLSIAAVIFCPVIIDLSSMQSFLSYVSYCFVTYYYLMGKEAILVGISLLSIVGYTLLRKKVCAS